VGAACGVFINGLTAWLFMSGSKSDINIKGAYLHMLADAFVSLAVVVVGGLVMITGWFWLDPGVTLLLVLVITWSTWGLLRDAVRLALQAVPVGIEAAAVRDHLAAQPGVTEVHDLHIWAMSTTENALTAHLVCPAGHPGDVFLHQLAHDIEHRFGIHHVTLQIEVGDASQVCALAPDHVV
jgi:cobalt-zinc-cadmium efflux system protein